MAMGIGMDDALTGLHDRSNFLSLLRRQVAQANDRQDNLALLVLDIDGFARINGAHGYAFGDRLLAAHRAPAERGGAQAGLRRAHRQRPLRDDPAAAS